MEINSEKSHANSARLSSIQGEASLSGSPCRGVCTTTYGDFRCGSCGREQEDITNWNTYSSLKRKLINLKNAGQGFKIRQLESQEYRWKQLSKISKIDNLTVKDMLLTVINAATFQSEVTSSDLKCIEIAKKITSSDHAFNEVSVKSLLSEDDYKELQKK
jgi:predicted Fe-S protein YdhL (DUF1289 family)